MKIKVADVPDSEPLALIHKYRSDVKELNFDDQVFTQPIMFQGSAWKESDCLFVDGKITSRVERRCGRCDIGVETSFEQSLRLTVDIGDLQVLDITDDIREVIILEHPIRFLCPVDQKGICRQCGKNVATGLIHSDAEDKENAFRVLKKKR